MDGGCFWPKFEVTVLTLGKLHEKYAVYTEFGYQLRICYRTNEKPETNYS
jgi:hypothetical protein